MNRQEFMNQLEMLLSDISRQNGMRRCNTIMIIWMTRELKMKSLPSGHWVHPYR